MIITLKGGDPVELGQKLKQARLEAGLSQRQLCGDTITRNMLSQIENGSAKPSLATLQILSARLGKPVSYFWEDAPSENLGLLHQAASAPAGEAMAMLQNYLPDDPILDTAYYLLCCRCCMDLAEQALSEKRTEYGKTLLQQAQEYADRVPSFSQLFGRRLILLRFLAGEEDAAALADALPDNTDEMTLRAKAALHRQDPERCIACLTAADRLTDEGLLLKGDALLALQRYEEAANCFSLLIDVFSVYPRLEYCYRELGDYKKAYEYACMQR